MVKRVRYTRMHWVQGARKTTLMIPWALAALLAACGGATSSSSQMQQSGAELSNATAERDVAADRVSTGWRLAAAGRTGTAGRAATLAAPASASASAASTPVATSTALPASASAASAPANDYHPSGYQLVFADEFDGQALDRSKWCTRYLYAGGPPPQVADAQCQRFGGGTLDYLVDQQQRHVDFNSAGAAMHVVSGGTLTLLATKTRPDARAPYESGMVRSKALFRPDAKTNYYITARVKLPNVRGTWPAFWLNSDFNADGTTAWPPEIDIFEAALNENWDTASMLSMQGQAQNWGGTGTTQQRQYTFASPQFDKQRAAVNLGRTLRDTWLETGAEWSETEVCFFVDGYKVACQAHEWKTNSGQLGAPAHVLLNLGIGGSWAGAFGIDDAKFPTAMQVDYVRVYLKAK
ncbi:MAG: glycoside hydrolase family 16 protein [Burkholderiaceae bacterium]